MSAIFTLGHSTLPIETFLQILRDQGIQIILDIRTVPRSRHNPQFAQENLAPALHRSEIAYEWHRNLGGLRHPRPDSINTGWRNSSFRGYADYMQTTDFAAALDPLLHPGPDPPPRAVLCAEAMPWRCHRSLVSDALTVRDVIVEHILYDKQGRSRREPHRLTSFARVEGSHLWYPGDEPANLFSAANPSVFIS